MVTSNIYTHQMPQNAPPGWFTPNNLVPLKGYMEAKITLLLEKKSRGTVVGQRHTFNIPYQKVSFFIDVQCTGYTPSPDGRGGQYQLVLYDFH